MNTTSIHTGAFKVVPLLKGHPVKGSICTYVVECQSNMVGSVLDLSLASLTFYIHSAWYSNRLHLLQPPLSFSKCVQDQFSSLLIAIP